MSESPLEQLAALPQLLLAWMMTDPLAISVDRRLLSASADFRRRTQFDL